MKFFVTVAAAALVVLVPSAAEAKPAQKVEHISTTHASSPDKVCSVIDRHDVVTVDGVRMMRRVLLIKCDGSKMVREVYFATLR